MALNFLNNGYFAGKVGIGTDSPDTKLSISDILGISGTGNNTYGQVDLVNTQTGASGDEIGPFITFRGKRGAVDTTIAAYGAIGAVNTGVTGNSTGALTFLVKNAIGAAQDLVEQMRITTGGNVGIGTTTPDAKLNVTDGGTQVAISSTYLAHLQSASNCGLAITAGSSSNNYIAFGDSDNYDEGIINYNNSTRSFAFRTADGALDDLVIDSLGNVGIGTTLPAGLLEINGGTGVSTSGGTLIVRQDGDANTDGIALTSSNAISHRIWKDANGKLNIGPSTLTSALVQDLLGNVGIGTTNPGAKLVVTDNTSTAQSTLVINHSRSDSDAESYGLFMDVNLSGADTTTADRTNRGIFLDLDSSADGDAANEHRIRGINSDVRFTGFSDIVQAGYFFAESNNSTEKTAQLVGCYGYAVHDSSSTDGGVSNMYGVIGQSGPQDLGEIDNAFGGYFSVELSNSRGDADFGVSKAVEGHINIDKAAAVNYGTMVGISSIIDNNEGSVPNFGDQYLFKGDYQGTRGGSAYGVYCEGDKHYFEGNVGIGTTSPGYPFSLENSGTGLISRIYNTNADGQGLLIRAGATTSATRAFQVASFNDTKIMTVNSNGRVGIGTASPSRTLHVSTDSGVLIKGASGSTNAKISLLPASGGRQYDLGNVGSDFRIFDASASVTRMYFDNDGNTGIGTTSPDTKLEVRTDSGAASANSYFRVTAGAAGAYGGTAHFEGAYNDYGNVNQPNIVGKIDMASEVVTTTDVGGTMKFFTKATGGTYATAPIERMRITSAGNVGIGTTSPGAILDVEAGDTGGAQGDSTTAAIFRAGRQNVWFQNQRTAAGTDWNNNTFKIIAKVDTTSHQSINFVNDASYNEHIDIYTGNQVFNTRFTHDGNVGIGTTGPSYKLDVENDSNIIANFESTTNKSAIRISDDDTVGYISAENGRIGFGTSPILSASNITMLTSNNNVGIGTTGPASLLSLQKDDNTVYDPTSDDGQRAIGPTILLNNNSTTTNTFGQIMYDTDSSGQGVARIVFLDAGTASSAIAFVTEQSDSIGERMRIDSVGNVGIGTASPSEKLSLPDNAKIGLGSSADL